MSIFGKIINLVVGLFNAAKAKFKSLPVEDQEAFKDGSKAVQIIKTNISLEANLILDLLQRNFPQYSDGKITAVLIDVGKQYGFAVDTAIGIIESIKAVSDEKETVGRKDFWTSLHKLIANSFADGRLDWSDLNYLAQFVYELVIKKKN